MKLAWRWGAAVGSGIIGALLLRSLGMRFFPVALATLLCVAPAYADELKLSFNADAFRVEYARPFTSNALEWGLGWLRSSDDGDVVNGDLSLTGQVAEGQNPLTGGLGLRLAYVNGDVSKQDGLGVSIGGFFKYAFPAFNRLFVGGHVYFAPSVLSVGELDGYQDLDVRIGYNILREADIYLGLRYVEGKFDVRPKAKFDSGLHLGVALRF